MTAIAEPEAARAGVGADAPHVSFVLPAYNEEDRLPAGLETVIAFLATQSFDSEIVVADDGSRDRTPDIVRERAAAGLPKHVEMRLVQHSPNQGKGAAIRMGVLAAAGQYVFFMDADLGDAPEESLKLLADEGGAAVVAGSRIQPNGSDMRASQPAQRRMVGRLFTFMRKAMRAADIDDTQCPLKGFEHDAAQAIFEQQQSAAGFSMPRCCRSPARWDTRSSWCPSAGPTSTARASASAPSRRGRSSATSSASASSTRPTELATQVANPAVMPT